MSLLNFRNINACDCSFLLIFFLEECDSLLEEFIGLIKTVREGSYYFEAKGFLKKKKKLIFLLLGSFRIFYRWSETFEIAFPTRFVCVRACVKAMPCVNHELKKTSETPNL